MLESGTGPAAARFWIAGNEYSYGSSPMGSGIAQLPPVATTGADGKFRVCDLRPGPYRLTAHFVPPGTAKAGAQYGTFSFIIADRDVKDVRVMAGPGLPVPGTVVWDGPAPDPPLNLTLSVSLRNVNRNMGMQGDTPTFARTTAPGEFRMESVPMDDYSVFVNVNSPGVYVKDILYGTASARYELLHLGTAIGEGGLRIVLARDGGTIRVRVTDKDGKGAADTHVAVLPAEPVSEAMMAAALVLGDADQHGNFFFGVAAPGKYLVIATDDRLDRGAESINRLWGARARATEVELRPEGSAQVTVERTTLQ